MTHFACKPVVYLGITNWHHIPWLRFKWVCLAFHIENATVGIVSAWSVDLLKLGRTSDQSFKGSNTLYLTYAHMSPTHILHFERFHFAGWEIYFQHFGSIRRSILTANWNLRILVIELNVLKLHKSGTSRMSVQLKDSMSPASTYCPLWTSVIS